MQEKVERGPEKDAWKIASPDTLRNAMSLLFLLPIFEWFYPHLLLNSIIIWVNSCWHSWQPICVSFLFPSKWYFEIKVLLPSTSLVLETMGIHTGIWGRVEFRYMSYILLFPLISIKLPISMLSLPTQEYFHFWTLTDFPRIFFHICDSKFGNNTSAVLCFREDFPVCSEIFTYLHSFVMH